MRTEITEAKGWEKTNVTNLLRNGESGIYYARVKSNGKQKWRSLKYPPSPNSASPTDSQAIKVATFAVAAIFLSTAGWLIFRNLRHIEPGLHASLSLPWQS